MRHRSSLHSACVPERGVGVPEPDERRMLPVTPKQPTTADSSGPVARPTSEASLPASTSHLPAPSKDERALRSSSDQAATYLRRLIFDGVLRPGSRVPQDQVAEALGLSRIPIREALVALSKEGRITLEHNRGAFVATTSERGERDLAELVGLAHGFAGRRAAERATDAFLAEVGASLERLRGTEEGVGLSEAFDDLEERIVDFGVGGRIAGFLRDLRVQHPGSLYDEAPALQATVKAHAEEIVGALTARDEDAVDDAFRRCHRAIVDGVVASSRVDTRPS
jgi:DNA-binding GntR family transcriptional regulator